jgi:death on curing protein
MATSSIYYLEVDDVREICFSLVNELLQFEEPLPEFETRFSEKLESILEIPKHGFGDRELYPSLSEKGACYFYFTIKNHPYLNGNKRLAIVTTYVFLRLNGVVFEAPWKDMYTFAIKLANSTVNHKDEFKETVSFIKNHIKQ